MNPPNTSLYIGLSIKRLAQMRCDGTGPHFVKVGGRVFYFKEDVDNWINQSGRAASTAEIQFKKLSVS
jgi:hypothetical protein